jgi:murein DD-endopeptidase MepM/ murein hydrolase activator NlpD
MCIECRSGEEPTTVTEVVVVHGASVRRVIESNLRVPGRRQWLPAVRALLVVTLAAAAFPASAGAYGWPLKPFTAPHPIRGSFGDPRYHLGTESALSSFHFGVDIAARDGQAVYAVEPGYIHAYAARLTITTRTSREFGFWHVKPVVSTGVRVKAHQLIGHVIAGWGHVHFAERYRGSYKDPLRKGALTPYYDKTVPVVDQLQLFRDDGGRVDPNHVTGGLGVVFRASDTPQLLPPAPWDVARLAPALVYWTLTGPTGGLAEWFTVADFQDGLPPPDLPYSWIYAPGTYQNKPHRPGNYLFNAAHSLDTTAFPDGRYTLTVSVADDRWNVGTTTIALEFANGIGLRLLSSATPR